MLILALDTATAAASIAVTAGERVVAEMTINTGRPHSELLMLHIAALLKQARLDKKDLQGIAVSTGPGSFTGLRIGLSTAKGLAYALGLPIAGVSTLAALAYQCPAPGAIVSPVLNAQRGMVYNALYTWEAGTMRESTPPRLVGAEALARELVAAHRPAWLLGDGLPLMTPFIAPRDGLTAAPPHLVLPRAAAVGLLGAARLNGHGGDDVLRLEPFYIRRSAAEVTWERRQRERGEHG